MDRKFGQGPPPPSFGQNPKEQLLFGKPSLTFKGKWFKDIDYGNGQEALAEDDVVEGFSIRIASVLLFKYSA